MSERPSRDCSMRLLFGDFPVLQASSDTAQARSQISLRFRIWRPYDATEKHEGSSSFIWPQYRGNQKNHRLVSGGDCLFADRYVGSLVGMCGPW